MDEESGASKISDVSYGAVSDDFFSDEEEEQMLAEISQEAIDNFVEHAAENSREPSMEIVGVVLGVMLPVDRGQRIAQIPPKFPHELWNVYQRTVDGKNRINNYAKAENRRIQREMGMERPTMGYFIDRLKLIQRGRNQAHARWLQGYQAKPNRTKYRQADERILKVIEQ
ncbi:hypothetical protein DdX_18543 [Ditylenchus destructor]|uniref:Uncharacterized protein n=1 Tax=Ditylenchus destructor TaxID=166010 RepID=A0AAD4MK10_9BILA|nr:hypothetical protein DdX_18543 [Ditylenchus destructor]